MLHNDCAAQQKVLGILIASRTGVQLHAEERDIWERNHSMDKTTKRIIGKPCTKEQALQSGIWSSLLAIISSLLLCSLLPIIKGDFAVARGQADAADFDNDIQILFEKRDKKKLAWARGICIQNTLAYLNIHSRQCRTVRTACVCYANGVHLALCFH